MLRLPFVYFLFLFSWFNAGCQQHQETQSASYNVSNDDLINMNRAIVSKDGDVIRQYLKDSKIDMTQTLTGLWYRIDKVGEGDLAKVGQTVFIKYKVMLLDGTLCYQSDSLGVKSFRLGQGGVESGLEEGLLLLRKGGKGSFVMPPHLAHGLTGDNDKIPRHSILLYEAEIVELK